MKRKLSGNIAAIAVYFPTLYSEFVGTLSVFCLLEKEALSAEEFYGHREKQGQGPHLERTRRILGMLARWGFLEKQMEGATTTFYRSPNLLSALQRLTHSEVRPAA